MKYWRCQSYTEDSPMEFVIQGLSKEALEQAGYDVCGGPYNEKEEAEFWLYGGPQCNIMLLDLEKKEIDWLLRNPESLSKEELEWLKG